jgi:hypothetical protein
MGNFVAASSVSYGGFLRQPQDFAAISFFHNFFAVIAFFPLAGAVPAP